MGAGVTVRYDKMVWIYIISCHNSKIWHRRIEDSPVFNPFLFLH